MTFIREHQLDIMLYLSGISTILTFTVLILNSISRRRKIILGLMAFSATLILISERCAYLCRGTADILGYYVVRISNGLVFFLYIFILSLVTQYLKDILKNEGRLSNSPFFLKVSDVFFAAGTILIFISQFTNLYYYFDANNTYHRSPGMPISYIPPFMIILFQMITVIRYRKSLGRRMLFPLLFCIVLPSAASVIQLFAYGISLTSMALSSVVILYYIYMLTDMNKRAEAARARELSYYKDAKRIKAAMFEQTVEALVNSIDAKDIYTHGHSSRVAVYSRRIAQRAGFPKADCENVYFAALLHDIGKIGVPDRIINKTARLNDDENRRVKDHTLIGDQILRSIKDSPTLCIGAHYHHERYDGSGYPEGLAGEDIPWIARVISVADAFDAMTTTRSYRDPLPISIVRQELIDGMGTQFDPVYAQIMLDLIDCGDIKVLN